MADNETAFVLPPDAVPGSNGPIHFGGFPGVYVPGQPVAVSELDFPTVKDARDAKNDQVPELTEKSVKAGSAPMPVDENHLPNTEELAAQNPEAVDTPEEAPVPAEEPTQ